MDGVVPPPILEARAISKSFPGVQALLEVDFTCRAGVVHALVGENGAGKSTLAGIFSGDLEPDSGELRISGKPVRFKDPHAAIRAGIAAAYQERSLLPYRSVAENVFLGHEPARRGVIHRQHLRDRTIEILESLGLGEIAVDQPAGLLSSAQMQIVEIAKAVAHDARVLIMDEPSAVLAGAEFERLVTLIRSLASGGVSIVYISHRLSEIETIADEVTVLRDGAVVSKDPIANISRDQMIRRMVGRGLRTAFPSRHSKPGEPVLEVVKLRLPGIGPDGLSFVVHAGEILGLAGLMGSGRSRLARAVIGLEPHRTGDVKVKGTTVPPRGARAASRRGLVMTPEDRIHMGLVLDLSVEANISLAVLGDVSRGGLLNRRKESALGLRMIQHLSIRTTGPQQVARELSGGNQQKVVLSKWLATEPTAIILDEPFRGVDVGAKAEIYSIVRSLADSGAAILLISSELPELLGLADRILVMRDGDISGELSYQEATEEAVMALAVAESNP